MINKLYSTRNILLIFLVVMPILAFTSLLVGSVSLSLTQVLNGLLGTSDQSKALQLIVQEVRLPRTLLALLIGAGLGASGAALQGWLRNPLAEPGLIGVSGGAVLGAVIAFYFGFSSLFAYATPLFAIAGAFFAVLLVYLLAGYHGSPLTLILAGIAINALASALTSLALNFAQNPFAITEIVFWMMGSLADRSFDHFYLAVPFILTGLALLLFQARNLDAMSLGEDVAASLGVSLARTQFLLITGIALCVGGATAVAGMIGFVGLMVPHLLRPFALGKPGRLVFLSTLGGAVLLLASDIAVRLLTPDTELKLGVITALLGAPFFLILVFKTQKGRML